MSGLKPLEHQVAGHPASVLTSPGGDYIVKPSLPLEIEFYESTAPAHFVELVRGGYIAKFFGTESHDKPPKEGKVKIEQAIKLENLTYGYLHPNVIDIKLGTQLYDPFDPNLTPDKQARMESESARTTSGSDGIRLTGFTVYDASKSSYVSTPKEYGKAIPSSALSDGIRRFFPVAEEDPSSHPQHDLTPSPPAGLPAPTLLPVLEGVLSDVGAVYSIVQNYEWRVAGGSLLIVYEGDPAASANGTATKYAVKMIDFAHARFLPGKGRDEGVCKGLESVIRLLQGRIAEVQRLL